MKSTTIKDILLLTIAGLVDVLEEINDPFHLYSNYYQNYYGYVPENWKKQNLVSALYQAKKSGLIVKAKIRKKSILRLTDLGCQHIAKRYPQLGWHKKLWDGRWRLIFFDIKELNRRKRNYLRQLLKKTGFIMIQKSVWLTPSKENFNFLKEQVKKESLVEKIFFIVSNNIEFCDEETLIEKIWRLKEINHQLKEMLFNLKLIKNRFEQNKTDGLKMHFDRSYKKLMQLALCIPHLPKKYYPKGWLYQDVVDLANMLKNKIPSQTFLKNEEKR